MYVIIGAKGLFTGCHEIHDNKKSYLRAVIWWTEIDHLGL